MRIVSALLCLLFFVINHLQGQAQTNLSRKIDSFLMTQFKPDEPGGVVLVAKNGNVLYKKAFGMADLELNVPVNDSMIFYIGSNTKQFTAVAILQLVEKNKLQLQDTLGKFIALKDDLAIAFTKEPGANIPALTITQNKKNKQYLKLSD